MPPSYQWLLVAAVLMTAVTCQEEEELKFEQSSRPSIRNVHPTSDCPSEHCHITDRCVPAGQSAEDACWLCDPSRSAVAWSFDDKCLHPGLDLWHLILIIVGSVLLVVMLLALAGYRMRRHLKKRQQVYPNYVIDVPYDRPLLKQTQ